MDRLEYTDKTKGNKYLNAIAQLIISIILTWGFVGAIADIGGYIRTGKIIEGGYQKSITFFWNNFADIMGNKDYVLLTKRLGEGSSSSTFLTVTFILIVVIVFLIMILGSLKFLLVFAIPYFTVPFILGLGPNAFHLTLFVCGLALAVVNKRFKGNVSLWNIGAVLLVFLIVINVSNIGFVRQKLESPQISTKINKSIHTKLDDLRYGKSPLGEGDLTGFVRQVPKGTAMQVTMDKPQSMYIRGFVGDTRKNDGWGIFECSKYYGSIQTLQEIKNTGLEPHSQLAKVDRLVSGTDGGSDKAKVNHVKMVTKDASSKYIYMPYEFSGGVIKDSKDWGGSFVTGTKFPSTKEYEYQVTEPITEKWTELYGKFFTKPLNKDIETYFKAESELNVDIYKKYTKMDPMDVTILRHYIGEPGNQEKGHIAYSDAIHKVLDYMDKEVDYTERFKLGKGDNTATSVFTTNRGYDVQYASAATLMFRYYGIPARYVEGYILTPDNAKHMQAGKAFDLPLSNVHAWTEIYVDGLGWLPVETVPKYKEMMNQPDYSKGLENNTNLNPFEQPPNDNDNQDDNDSNDDGGQEIEQMRMSILMKIIIVVAIILLIILLYLFLSWYLERRAWEKVFKGSDRKLAVCALFQYMRNKDLNVSSDVRELAEKTSYSPYVPNEHERTYMYRMKKIEEKQKKAMIKQTRRNRVISALKLLRKSSLLDKNKPWRKNWSIKRKRG